MLSGDAIGTAENYKCYSTLNNSTVHVYNLYSHLPICVFVNLHLYLSIQHLSGLTENTIHLEKHILLPVINNMSSGLQ
jgi:hypothetical protein